MTLTTEVLRDPQRCREVATDWDALAVATRQPFCAPGWMLAWWDAAAPSGAILAVVLVRDDGRLVGVAPTYVQRDRLGVRRYRFLASPVALRTEPLALAGVAEPVARAIAAALAGLPDPPDALFFDGVAAGSPWPALFARHLPGRRSAWLHTHMRMAAPIVRIEHRDGEQWLASKSKNFREQTRRRRRKLEAEGAVFRPSALEEVDADLGDMARLHHARWDERGGSAVLSPPVETMLRSAARLLLPEGRLRLWMIEVDGETISAHLFLAAGGEVSYWLGGFDDRWSAHQPALQVLVVALQDAIERGDERLDLGGGAQPYKYRLADSEEVIRWVTVLPRGSRYVLAQATTAPRHIRRAVLSRIPDDLKNRVKKALGRPSSPPGKR